MSKPVTFGEWLQHHGLDWRAALCINLATDGLNPGFDHLLAVGLQFPGESPEYIYVRGGFPSKTEMYHGITVSHYSKSWVGPSRAQELLRDFVAEAQFLVVGNREFFNSWLLLHEPPLLVLGDYPVFGLTDYAKFLDSNERLFLSTGNTVDSIMELISFNVRDMRYQSGYSVDSLVSRIVGELPDNDGIVFENKTVELTRLYCSLLWA
jgi:hypothetical protein